MKRISRVLSGAVLVIGALAVAAPIAFAAHDPYPPGWNQPATNLPRAIYVFKSGCGWGDYQLYSADQVGCGSPKSHPISYGPVIYQMNPQGERYHRVD